MKIGLVGCGTIASVHAECMLELQKEGPVCVADKNIKRAQVFASQYGGNPYASLEEMLENEEMDVLHICTPHYLHVPMALLAMQKGVSIFMEKPPVISKEQLSTLKEALLHTNQKLGICFQNRYNPSILEVKCLLDAKEAGEIYGGRAFVTWSRDLSYYKESGWRGSLATEGGGVLINQAIHTMDLLVYLIGPPKAVDATMTNHHLSGAIEVEDTLEAWIEWEHANASFYATTAYCTDRPPLIELECEHMTIRIEDLAVTYFYRDGRIFAPRIPKKSGYGKSYWGMGHRDCISEFYQCIKENKPFPLSLTNVEPSIKLMLATYKSARSKKRVEIEGMI